MNVEGSFADVRNKAKAIRAAGGVRIIADQDGEIVAYVKGTHNIYQTSILRTPGSRQSIAAWTCFLPDAPVMMADGTEKPISEVVAGDLVISHTGEIRRVLRSEPRPYEGDLVSLTIQGDPRPVTATAEHLVYGANLDFYLDGRGPDVAYSHTGSTVPSLAPVSGWTEIGSLVPGDYLSRPQGLNTAALLVSVPRPAPRTVDSASGVRGVAQISPNRWHFRYKTGGRDGYVTTTYFDTRDEAVAAAGQHRDSQSHVDVKVGVDLAYWLGWYAAEGYLVKNRYRVGFSLSSTEQWVVDQIDDIAWREFGVRGTTRYIDNKIDYRVSHFALYHLAQTLVGQGSKTKELSRGMMSLPAEERVRFLAGWFGGDGAAERSGRHCIATTSPMLARQARELLTAEGYTVSIQRQMTNPGGLPTTQNAGPIDVVRWQTRKNQVHQFRQDGQVWQRITDVAREHYSGEVWDIEVEVDHSFRAYGFNVHNCGCPWGSVSWGRSGRWKKFEGRGCSHLLALQYEASSRGMFGKEIVLDEKTPSWQDSSLPIRTPGEFDISKGKYAHLDPWARPYSSRTSGVTSGGLTVTIEVRAHLSPANLDEDSDDYATGDYFGGDATASINGTHIGFMSFGAHEDHGDNHPQIGDMEVNSHYQRKGVGRALVEAVRNLGIPLAHYPTDAHYSPAGRAFRNAIGSIKEAGMNFEALVDGVLRHLTIRTDGIFDGETNVDDRKITNPYFHPTRGLSLTSARTSTITDSTTSLAREFVTRPLSDEFWAGEIDDLSRSYRNLPIKDDSVVPLWQELGAWVTAQADNLRRTYTITVHDDADPYTTSEQMLADIARSVYEVTSMYSNHPVWDKATNVNFRITHDITGHGLTGSDFSFRGEIIAYRNQCESTPAHLWPVLFTEVVAQSAYVNCHHLFGEQKVALLPLTQDEIDAHVGQVMDGPDKAYDPLHVSASQWTRVADSLVARQTRTHLARAVLAATDSASAASAMTDLATASEPLTTPIVEGAAQQAGATMFGQDQKVKDPGALGTKIDQTMGHHDMDPAKAAAGVPDSLRYGMTLDPEGYTQGVNSVMSNLTTQGINPTATSPWNQQSSPGTTVNAYASDGHPFEVQFHTPDSLAAHTQSAGDKDTWANSPNPNERRSAMDSIRQTHGAAEMPLGADQAGQVTPAATPDPAADPTKPMQPMARRASVQRGPTYHILHPDNDELSVATIKAMHGGDDLTAESAMTDLEFGREGLRLIHGEGGFTVHNHFGDAPGSGYMVSVEGSEQVIPVAGLKADDIVRFRAAHADALAAPDTFLGAWVEDGKVFLDVSKVVHDRNAALQAGRDGRQLAIYDLAAKDTVYVTSAKAAHRSSYHFAGDDDEAFVRSLRMFAGLPVAVDPAEAPDGVDGADAGDEIDPTQYTYYKVVGSTGDPKVVFRLYDGPDDSRTEVWRNGEWEMDQSFGRYVMGTEAGAQAIDENEANQVISAAGQVQPEVPVEPQAKVQARIKVRAKVWYDSLQRRAGQIRAVAALLGESITLGSWSNALRGVAVTEEPAITYKVSALAKQYGGYMQGLVYKFKDYDSLLRKLKDKYEKYSEPPVKGGPPVAGAGMVAAYSIADALRYTIVTPPDNYVQMSKNMMSSLVQNGYTERSAENYWQDQNDYKGINTNFTAPGGITFELQFHTPESFMVKNTQNHPLYTVYRDKNTPTEQRRDLYKQMQYNSNQIPIPSGNLGGLGTEKTRNKFEGRKTALAASTQYYEEHTLDRDTIGVFRLDDGILKDYVHGAWVERPSLAAYTIMGEPGATQISPERAIEIVESLGGSSKQVQSSRQDTYWSRLNVVANAGEHYTPAPMPVPAPRTAAVGKPSHWDEAFGMDEPEAALPVTYGDEQKTAMQRQALKDFSHVERQALINESNGARARTFGELRISNTMYAGLVDEEDMDGLFL